MINKYPYTDFHELNLDWFLEEFKKVTDKVTTLDATVQQFTEFVTNYFDNLDVQQEINNKLDQMLADGTLSDLLRPFFDEIAAQLNLQSDEIAVLNARVNAFEQLQDGSTTGDAELIDARIGYNGINYTTAGDAIRAQAKIVQKMTSLPTDSIYNDKAAENIWYAADGTISTYQHFITSGEIVVSPGVEYWFTVNKSADNLLFAWFDSSHTFISRNIRAGRYLFATAPVNAAYVRCGVYKFGSVMNLDTIMEYSPRVKANSPAVSYNLSANDTYVRVANKLDNVAQMIDENVYEEGYYTASGTLQSGGMFAHFYAPVTGGNTYVFKSSGSGRILGAGFAWFDAAFNFISRDNHAPFTCDFDHVAPANAKYIALSLWYDGYITSPSDIRKERVFLCEASQSMEDRITFGGTFVDRTLDHYDQFKGKRLSILGDSISTYGGSGGSAGHSGHIVSDGVWTYAGNCCRYPYGDVTSVYGCYWKMFSDEMGFEYGVNDSWAASRISWDGTEGDDVGANKYIASPTRIGHLDDNGTPDYILVNAGTNDITNNVPLGTFDTSDPRGLSPAQIAALPVATFADAVRALLIRLQTSYPDAGIVFMLPDYTTSFYDPAKADSYLEVIKEACDFFGVPVIDVRTSRINMYNVSTYTSDGVHPNAAGMRILAEQLRKEFKQKMNAL